MAGSYHAGVPTGDPGFQLTQWSLVAAANHGDTRAAHEALTQLCGTYWYPIYLFIRRRGHEAEPAKDLTQEFFARLIAKDYLRVADPARGRFRTFLLACVQHFLSNEYKKERALKRGGACAFLPLEEVDLEERYRAEPADTMSPDRLLDRRWALTLLELCLAQLRKEYAEAGKGRLFDALQGSLSGAWEAPASFAEIGASLGMSEGAVRQAAFRLRSRFGELLRRSVAQTVASPKELEAELQHLWASLQTA